MPTSNAERQGSPWFSVWLKPRVTIERILAQYSLAQVLLLVSLNTIVTFLVGMAAHGHLDPKSQDWRALVSVIIAAGVIGIAGLYLDALFFRISGRLFRGHATAADLRAVLAWGSAPTVMGLSICLAAFTGLRLSGAVQPWPQALEIALQTIAGVLAIWSLIATLLMLSRVQKFGFWRTNASAAIGYIPLLLIALLFRTFLFEPFNIPSESMAPNLVVGDYLFVSKYQYGYSRYSLPLGPRLFEGRIMGKEPERGDVVVYRQPKNPSVDFVKRVVGLPGDSIQVIEGVLQINGQPVPREPAEDYVELDESGHPLSKLKRWHETLPNGVGYDVLEEGRGSLENTAVYTVPTGRYFVMGDHRDKSADSRLPESQGGGSVPYENLIGQVEIIFYSADVRRIGTRVR